MTQPTPTWSVSILYQKKTISLGNYTGTEQPTLRQIRKMAKEQGYNDFNDYFLKVIDEGKTK